MVPTELMSQLTRYRAADAGEDLFLRRMQDLAGHPRPFDRSGYDPGHFTASAFVLSPDRKSLLLIFHRKLELWLQPGGHVDPTDVSLVQAARREVAEEVGLSELRALDAEEPIFDVDIHGIPARPKEPAHEHFDVRFAFVARSIELRPNAEVREAKWVELSCISRVTADRSVIRAVEKLAERGLR